MPDTLTPVSEPRRLSDAERTRLRTLAFVPVLLAVANTLGQIPSATLANEAPLLLIALSPLDPFLILTVNSVPTWAFFVVGFVRLVAADPFLYVLGRDFGPHGRAALAAELGERSRLIRSINWLDRWFPRFGLALIVVLPNYPVCLLSGFFRVPVWRFAVLNAIGTAGRLYLIWSLGRVFAGPIGSFVDFIGRYQWWAAGAMFLVVALQASANRQRPAD